MHEDADGTKVSRRRENFGSASPSNRFAGAQLNSSPVLRILTVLHSGGF